jgi:HlyD family secretion protein
VSALSVLPKPEPPESPRKAEAGLEEVIEEERSKHGRRRWILLGLAAVVVAATTITWFQFRPRPLTPAQRFRTEPVVLQSLRREVTATGRIEARSTVEVGAELSGRIDEVLVDYNDRVKAGDVLARFDAASVAAQERQARASLKAAKAAVKAARLELDEARRRRNTSRELSKKGIEPKDALESLESRVSLAEASLENAKAQVELQAANLSIAKTTLDRAVVVAPIDGQVLAVNVEAGQTVAASFQTPVLFLIAADLEEMRVLAQIDEADVGEVVAGQDATFTVDAYPGETFTAEVLEVRSAATIVQSVVTYEAVLDVTNVGLRLKPGMTASVRVTTKTVDEGLQVPNAALRFTPPGQQAGEGPAVWVLAGDSMERVAVELGVTDGRRTVVAGPGLKLGDEVIVDLTPEGREAVENGDG